MKIKTTASSAMMTRTNFGLISAKSFEYFRTLHYMLFACKFYDFSAKSSYFFTK